MIPLQKIYDLLLDYLKALNKNIKVKIYYQSSNHSFVIEGEKNGYGYCRSFSELEINNLFKFPFTITNTINFDVILREEGKELLQLYCHDIQWEIADRFMKSGDEIK